MSQQRPDRIKQMLHYLWQHRHLSTQQAMELFGYAEATVRRDFQYIANQYPGNDPRSRLPGLRRQYRRQRVRLRRENVHCNLWRKRKQLPLPEQ